MAVWPVSLPQSFPKKGVREERIEARQSFEPDAGSPYATRRWNAEPVIYTFPLALTLAQLDTLRTFYDATLYGGVDPFDWTHPWPSAGLVVFKFFRSPFPAEWDAEVRRVTLALIRHPWLPA